MEACNANTIKCIHFTTIETNNNEYFNKKMKLEFMMFLDNYEYRRVNKYVKYLLPNNQQLYCSIIRNNDRSLTVQANDELIDKFKQIVQSFDNTSHLI